MAKHGFLVSCGVHEDNGNKYSSPLRFDVCCLGVQFHIYLAPTTGDSVCPTNPAMKLPCRGGEERYHLAGIDWYHSVPLDERVRNVVFAA